MTTTKLDLKSLVQEADEAFWQIVVKHYPEATSGDLSPCTSIRLNDAQEDAIAEWIWANVPGANEE